MPPSPGSVRSRSSRRSASSSKARDASGASAQPRKRPSRQPSLQNGGQGRDSYNGQAQPRSASQAPSSPARRLSDRAHNSMHGSGRGASPDVIQIRSTHSRPSAPLPPLRSPPVAVLAQAASEVLAAQAAASARETPALVAAVQAAARRRSAADAGQPLPSEHLRHAAWAQAEQSLAYPVRGGAPQPPNYPSQGAYPRHQAVPEWRQGQAAAATPVGPGGGQWVGPSAGAGQDPRLSVAISNRPGIFEVRCSRLAQSSGSVSCVHPVLLP
jgi:hypothetical protein